MLYQRNKSRSFNVYTAKRFQRNETILICSIHRIPGLITPCRNFLRSERPTTATYHRIEFNYRCADIYFVNYSETVEPNGRTSRDELVKNLILYDDSRVSPSYLELSSCLSQRSSKMADTSNNMTICRSLFLIKSFFLFCLICFNHPISALQHSLLYSLVQMYSLVNIHLLRLIFFDIYVVSVL